MKSSPTSLVAFAVDVPKESGQVEYLVSHGKNGGFGRFIAPTSGPLHRGDLVVVQSQRGLEIGTVLCLASDRHVRLLVNTPAGKLLRIAEPQDLRAREKYQALSLQIFEESRNLAAGLGLALEILDVEVLLDGASAVLHFLGSWENDLTPLVDKLRQCYGVDVVMENLALPRGPAEEEHAGCGKPDCGKTDGGGCTSCGTGGGCSSCSSGKVDMAAYFSHLRGKMEDRARVPLL